MSFSIRPDRRFPICCPVTYHAGVREGHGLAWNLSVSGWRFSGDVPLRVGQPADSSGLTMYPTGRTPPIVWRTAATFPQISESTLNSVSN